MTGQGGAPLLEMRGIHKSFFGVSVLNDVSLTLYAGEVLALLGENGAGKSTLIKILNGDYTMDSGDIVLRGRAVHFAEPRDAEAHGIRMIYQEQHYAPDLTVMENLLLGELPRGQGFPGRYVIDWGEARRIAEQRLSLLDLKIDPARRMRDLPVVERQIVEIVKALSGDAQIIVMDEPTAALTPPEVKRLFGIIRGLCDRGVPVIYISHRLDEVFEIADRVTILRDGRHVATRPIGELNLGSMVGLMVGREIGAREQAGMPAPASVPVVLEVAHLSKAGAYEDVSFRVHAGEIVGVFGLIGSGQLALTRGIFGAEKPESGTVSVDGRVCRIRHPQDARAAGIGFVPVDRKVQSLIMGQSVRKNITLSNWQRLNRLGVFRQRLEKQHAQRWIDALGIRMAGGMEVPIRFLSGGNQQKAVLARWLEAEVRALILNEPTWGVDVGARSDIYEQLEALARDGLAILIVSSDIQEILAVSQRVLTIFKGRITAEFAAADATKDRLLAAAAGEAQ
ncbi:MAG: sugar ABC transporter ATP-binding protein [Anaerolineae bacterium]|nr:sugar ABC transporter ATP-binding protein [Anaerolineae bacterium]